jgi:Ca2+-binding RTX toxin-like protein/methionine-rich copper-binding protein CopC
VNGGDGDDWVNCVLNADGGVGYYSYSGSATIDGGAGNDYLHGTNGDDSLLGGLGNDDLSGRDGNDTLIGGPGSDTLAGWVGNDTYLFSKGDGSDTISNYDTTGTNTDKVQFVDVRSSDVLGVERVGNDLLIKYGATDQVVVSSYFSGVEYKIKTFGFSDGVVWADADIRSRAITKGTSGNDTLWGSDGGQNHIFGLGGNDIIWGANGNDLLDGGTGNDQIRTGGGSDVVNAGDGDDWVNCVLNADGSIGYYTYSGSATLDGGAGDDQLHGTSGDDSIVGGLGSDSLDGSAGNDSLDGGLGQNDLDGGRGNDLYIVRAIGTRIHDAEGDDSAIVSANFVKLPWNIEHVTYVDGALPLPYWLDAVTEGSAISTAGDNLIAGVKYYGFPDINLQRTSGDVGFAALPESHREFIRTFFASLEKKIGISFLETKDLSLMEASSTIVFSGAVLESNVGGDGGSRVRVNTFGNQIPVDVPQGLYVHEVGHVIGIKHPFSYPDARGGIADGPYLTDPLDLSIMGNGDVKVPDYTSIDLAALQYLYGVSADGRVGNSTYVLSGTTENFIWDGAGTDTLSASSQTQPVTLYLEPGYWSFIGSKAATITAPGQVTVNFGTVIENLIGGSGNDSLFGNVVDNRISGGAGDDTIAGGGGNDTIDGGGGTDTAAYEGSRSSYTITSTADGIVIASASDGSDTLANVEFVKFADQTVSLVDSDVAAPSVINFNPADESAAAPISHDIVFTFSEAIQHGSGTITLKTAAGTVAATYDAASSTNLSISGSTLTINPSSDLGIFSSYKVEIPAGAIKDLAGNSYAGVSDYNFSTETLDSLYHFCVVAFSAAPGTTFMGQMADAYNAGLSVKEIVNIFTTKPQFTSTYPESLTNLQLATALVNNNVKDSVSEAVKLLGIADIVQALDYGLSRGEVIYNVFGNLATLPLIDPAWNAVWGNTAIQFQNQTAVARYYTEVMGAGGTDLATLRVVIGSVDAHTDVSTPQVIATLIGVEMAAMH